jgi:hypothetical protein
MVSCLICRATLLIAVEVAIASAQHMIRIGRTIKSMMDQNMIAGSDLIATHEMTIEILDMGGGVAICKIYPKAGGDPNGTRRKLAYAAPATPKKMTMI